MWINPTTAKTYKLHSEIRSAFPDISMPANLSESVIDSLGLQLVTQTPKPAGNIVEEDVPIFIDSNWVQQWTVRAPTEEETVVKTAEVRNERDKLLSKTDWIITRAYEQQSQIPANYITYRQALRDITNQSGFPWEVSWPTLNN